MQHSRDYQDLLYACAQEGCPLCRLTQESSTRYLDGWKYDSFTDVRVREELRHSQGFCHTHTWQLARMGATLQLAQAYRDILSDTAEQLESEGKFTLLKRNTKKERTPCPACRKQDEMQARLISSLREALLDSVFYTRFSSSSGLCLEHFRLACEIKKEDTAREWLPLLRSAQIACLQRLDAQLGELIRKHDYRFKEEARGDEMLSWKRAAGLVAGEDVYT